MLANPFTYHLGGWDSTQASAAPPVSVPAPPPAPPPDPFEYYDAGNHWCKNCNVTSGSMFDFFTHLHSKTHRKTLDPYDRPWVSTPTKIIKTLPAEEKLTKPAKGSEFLLPVRGFFCLLCKQFYGDAICAEEHVTTHPHNEKYKKQMYENPLYEQRRNLDRQAGLVSETSGKKRKHEDDEKGNKDKEEKSKHKKEKRDKENKTEEDDADQKEEKSKVKKEEKQRTSKKEEESKDARSLEEEWPSHGQKDEDEKSKNSKKEDKYRHSREEEERGKYSRRDEDDRYKYSRVEEHRSRYRRDEHDRHDEQPKYGLREEEDKNKSSKYSDFRPTYDRERDEGKPKADKEAVKKLEPAKPAGKPEVSKPEPPPKPYDPPKILCGPSPAMRAKLRKQSLETSKPASTATTSSFGKFTWKKREDILAKEAEKVAAEFIKDDEAAANQNPVSVEDSFAKSMAVAKEIAEKLSGQQSTPSPPVSNRGRIRPNLPAPAAVLRKTTTTSKPAPLNTFLSIRPQSAGSQVPPAKEAQAFPGPLTNTLNAQSSLLESKLQTPVGRPDPSEARPTPPVSNSAPPGSNSAPPEIKPATPVSNSAPSEVKPAPPTMIRIVSDVAAPGVPESEQTHTVFVKPPPLMTMSIGPQKSAKPRSNLAAAKAQDLFGIFYSSISQPGTSSITKPATDARGSTTNKSQPPSLETQKPQPQRQPFTHSEPPTVVCTSPQVNSVHTPSSQTQPQSDLHIASVWSLQSTPPPTREVAASKTPSETAQTILSPPAQSEAQILPQNHSPTPESESRNVPQAEPALLEPTPETLSQPNLTSQNEAQQPTKPQPDQDTQTPSHPETPPDTVSLAEPQASPKTRGKTTPAKRNPPALRPVRQTRSQTRQQQQSQSESEPEPASADSDSAGSDPKGLDMSDVGSALHPGEEAPGKGDPQMMGLIPETLGLPSDMTSLDFETDFNFE